MADPGFGGARRARRSAARPVRILTVTVAPVVAVAVTLGAGGAGATTAAAATAVTTGVVVPALGYAPDDTGSLSAVTRIVGAQTAWASGWTGAGVDVALIDTGVAPVPGLDVPGKIVTGPDLSFDSPASSTPGLDGFGHGTFMAGLIAGRDAGATASATGCTTCLNPSGYSDVTRFVGVAPEARVVDVKVGSGNGTTDVTQVIAAIDWVAQHAHDPGLNIKVLSLSYGTDSGQVAAVDPLAQAAERAWKKGVVVVAAAGNDGHAATTLADPAYDPYVVAVGGDDPNGTLTTGDDSVPRFAEHGTLARPVDVIAPATHLLGLRVPGSFVDTTATNTGQVGPRFQRGSGTSEATAIVAGVTALLAQRHPDATPDQLKALLTATATPLPLARPLPAVPGKGPLDSVTAYFSGRGIVNAGAATSAAPPTAARAAQTAPASTGSGTLEAARGGVHVTDAGVALTGQSDIFGRPYPPAVTAAVTATTTSTTAPGPAWNGGIWNGSRWTGDSWSGPRWSPSAWGGTNWAGRPWTVATSSTMAWDGSRWSGSGCCGSRWTSSNWDGSRWSGSTWS